MSSAGAFDPNRKRTNANARLSAILDKLAADGTQRPVADVLVSCFEIQDRDPNRAFLLAYSGITHLLEKAQKEVETYLASQSDFYGRSFPRLRHCFTPKNSHAQWNTYKANLSAEDVTAIRFTAQRLKDIVPEYEATAEDFAEIRAAIKEMSEAIDSEALSAHTREALRDCLREIERALDEYLIWGQPGIDRAFKAFSGTLATDQTVLEDLREDKAKGGDLWDKVTKVGSRLTLLLGLLGGIYDVGQKYLPIIERLVHPHSIHSGATIEAQPHESNARREQRNETTQI